MKKLILVLILLLISSNVWSAGVLDMTGDATPTTDDIIYVINDPVGVPGDRKVQIGNLLQIWVNLSSINALTFADVSIIELTGVGGSAVVTSGGANRLLGSNAGNTALEFKSSLTGITLGGFTASYGVESNASGELVSVQPTGTGLTVRQTSSTLITPAITAPEIDGSTAFALSAAQVSRTIINNYGQAAADINLTLPTAVAGMTFIAICGTTQGANYWRFTSGSANIYANVGAGLVSGKTYVSNTSPVAGDRMSCFTFKTGAAAWSWMCGVSEGVWVTD